MACLCGDKQWHKFDELEFGKLMFLGLTQHSYAATVKQWHVCDEREFGKLMFLGLTRHTFAATLKQ